MPAFDAVIETLGDRYLRDVRELCALYGFGIFGQFGEGGKRLANADLDACHGHTHAIPWDGQTQTLYHYHMTREYPYSVGCFHGVRA